MVCAVGKIQVQPHCCETETPPRGCGCTASPSQWSATLSGFADDPGFPFCGWSAINATRDTNGIAGGTDVTANICRWTRSGFLVSCITGTVSVAFNVEVVHNVSGSGFQRCGTPVAADDHYYLRVVVSTGVDVAVFDQDMGPDPFDCSAVSGLSLTWRCGTLGSGKTCTLTAVP